MPKAPRGKATPKKTAAPKRRSTRPTRSAKRAIPEVTPIVMDQTEGGGFLPKPPGPKRDSALRAARARWDSKRSR